MGFVASHGTNAIVCLCRTCVCTQLGFARARIAFLQDSGSYQSRSRCGGSRVSIGHAPLSASLELLRLSGRSDRQESQRVRCTVSVISEDRPEVW